jgi:hypothetical protein
MGIKTFKRQKSTLQEKQEIFFKTLKAMVLGFELGASHLLGRRSTV